MDGTQIGKVLAALRELMSEIAQQMDGGNKDSSLHTASKFVQWAIAMVQMPGNQRNALLLNAILSTAVLVWQNLSWEAAYEAVFLVCREAGGLIEGRIPKKLAQSYHELQRLLDAASGKMKNIQGSCDRLLEQVIEACESERCDSNTFRRLEAYRLKAAAEIRDCEQTVNNAQEIIEQLRTKAEEKIVKNGMELGASGAATLALTAGAAMSFNAAGFTLGGCLMGSAGASGVICYNIAKKLGDWEDVWEEVDVKRKQYRQIINRLESLKVTFETDVNEAVQLTRPQSMPQSMPQSRPLSRKKRFTSLFTCCKGNRAHHG